MFETAVIDIAELDQLLSVNVCKVNIVAYYRYLYWLMHNPISGGGLYRTDLIEFESGCISSEKAELIVNDNQISAFAVDYKNFRLLLPAASNNTIVSVALDGGDVTDIRENAQTPQYRNIQSMAVHQNLLYWTTGKALFGEEYHKKENKFYQNIYSVGEGSFLALNVHHSDGQPHPGTGSTFFIAFTISAKKT